MCAALALKIRIAYVQTQCFSNNRSNIHKGSGDKAIASAPDVCKTPVGNAVVPIPYPNISQSSTLKKGSKSVKINGQPAALKGSTFASSNGGQAGSLGGIVSGVTGKETEFVSYSFDVKIEGENVVRHADMTTHNNKNTIGMVYGSSTSPQKIEPEKCPYCGKPEHDFAKEWGTNMGSGQALRKEIIDPIDKHPWYTGTNSLQAHHLICSESMDDDDWSQYCRIFGYSINHKNNGVMLPYEMALACQLHVALHRGNHDQGVANGNPYPEEVKLKLKEIRTDIKAGKYCDNPKGLVDELDDFSHYIVGRIDKFKWTITADGKDYVAGKNGCAGVSSLTKKPSNPCPHDRVHGLTKQNETAALPRKSSPLETGK